MKTITPTAESNHKQILLDREHLSFSWFFNADKFRTENVSWEYVEIVMTAQEQAMYPKWKELGRTLGAL